MTATTFFPTAHTWNPFVTLPDDLETTTIPPHPPGLSTGKEQLTEPFSQVHEKMTTFSSGDHHEIAIHEQDDELTSIILIAVMVATLLVFVCVLLVVRHSLKHKGSYYTQEDKEGNWEDADDAALKGGHSFEDLAEDV